MLWIPVYSPGLFLQDRIVDRLIETHRLKSIRNTPDRFSMLADSLNELDQGKGITRQFPASFIAVVLCEGVLLLAIVAD